MNVTKQYFKYVSQNIFGLLGTSCYILADTYFIAQAAGTDGVAMLNLCLPIYNLLSKSYILSSVTLPMCLSSGI